MKFDTRSVPPAVAALAASLWIVSAAPVSAQGPSQPAVVQAPVVKTAQGIPSGRPAWVRQPRPAGGTGAISSRSTSIQGVASHADNTPISKALLRLRNVTTGKVEATTTANDEGEFAFTGIGDGTYLIEMVSERGKVMMVGHTFFVAPGETVATFVRLVPKVPWFNGFFGNAALTVASAAASAGVLALAPKSVTPISANR